MHFVVVMLSRNAERVKLSNTPFTSTKDRFGSGLAGAVYDFLFELNQDVLR